MMHITVSRLYKILFNRKWKKGEKSYTALRVKLRLKKQTYNIKKSSPI